jgi:hypothetical protein
MNYVYAQATLVDQRTKLTSRPPCVHRSTELVRGPAVGAAPSPQTCGLSVGRIAQPVVTRWPSPRPDSAAGIQEVPEPGNSVNAAT